MSLLILIVDDNLGIRVSVSDYLKLKGYRTITAKNGVEALSLLEQYHPNLLISDINMPVMDGYTLVHQIRQKSQFKTIPVIFLTERNSTQERIKGYKLGCDLYLPKPFELEELTIIIHNLLKRSQLIERQQQLSVSTSLAISQSQELLAELELTPREKDVLALLSQGLSNIEIGQALFLSHRTIEKYVSRLLRKTNTNNRKELLRFSLKHHLVE